MGNVCHSPAVATSYEEPRLKTTEAISSPSTTAATASQGSPRLDESTNGGGESNVTVGQARRIVAEAKSPIAAVAAPEAKTKDGFQERTWREISATAKTSIAEVPGKIKRRPSSENITLDAYSAKHATMFERLLALEDNTGWQFKREDEGVRIYLKSEPGQVFCYFKGVTDVKVDGGVPQILAVLLNTEQRPKWDELCLKGSTEQYFPPFYKYAYTKFTTPAKIICPRELMLVGRFRFEEDGSAVVAMQSVEYPEMPIDPDFVRVNFIEGGYIVRPKPGTSNEFTITYTGCVDPKGWIPTWLANLVAPKQALTLAKVKKFF
mmetsp:Transcript_47703/g.139008  ORF Transcript_47703/g.139008 Transcript_47703/m.139008 type:complete len:321 (-) Transcript_47703:130-1092(-)